MKKLLSLVLALLLCLCLCACGSDTDNRNDKTTNTTEEKHNEAGEAWVIYDKNGSPYVNKDKLAKTLEIVQLTTENWRSYIKVYSYDGIQNCLGAGNERYHQYNNVSVELKHKATGEVVTYEWSDYSGQDGPVVAADFDLDNYECSKISGRIFFFELPEEFSSSDSFRIAWYEGELMMASATPFLIMEGTKAIVSMDEIVDIIG